jgi:CheY-like chemotaxis protein
MAIRELMRDGCPEVHCQATGSRSHSLLTPARIVCKRSGKSAKMHRGNLSMSKVDERSLAIYIVDDDDDVRFGFARLIRSVGINARPYASAECFLDELVDGEQGCVLLDLTMPRVTGHHVLARLKQLGSRLPVIVVSARDDEMTRAMVRDLGAKMFLRKPVDDQALLDAINWATGFSLGR